MNEYYDFIIQKPWLLDEYIMPALEKEMLVRLTNDQSGEMFPFRSVHILAIDTLEYYKEQKIPFSIEVHSLNSTVRMRFVSLLANAIGSREGRHTTIEYHDAAVPYFTLRFDYVEDEQGNMVTSVDYSLPQRDDVPALTLELLGYKDSGGVFEYLTVLYDRQQQKHGFVRLLDGAYYLVALERDLLLQHVHIVGTLYDQSFGSIGAGDGQEEEEKA